MAGMRRNFTKAQKLEIVKQSMEEGGPASIGIRLRGITPGELEPFMMRLNPSSTGIRLRGVYNKTLILPIILES